MYYMEEWAGITLYMRRGVYMLSGSVCMRETSRLWITDDGHGFWTTFSSDASPICLVALAAN